MDMMKKAKSDARPGRVWHPGREIRQGGKPRPAQEAASLLDNLGCRLHKFIRKRDALLLGGSRVDEEFEVVAAFEGDVAGFFTLQNARHHAAGLFAEIAVVDAHRRSEERRVGKEC